MDADIPDAIREKILRILGREEKIGRDPESSYIITESGQVFRETLSGVDRKSIITNKEGYQEVHKQPYLTQTKKRFSVHRMVARAFHGPAPTPDAIVRHLDGVKSNNHADNLKWGTHKENAADRVKHFKVKGRANGQKLTHEQVMIVRKLLEMGVDRTDLAVLCGVVYKQITLIARGECFGLLGPVLPQGQCQGGDKPTQS